MTFTSPEFLFFSLLILILYGVMRPAYRWGVLLAASLIFYAGLGAPYLLVALGIVTLVSYGLGRWFSRVAPEKRKGLLIVGVAVNLSVLIFFRYLPDLYRWLIQTPTPPAVAPVLIVVGVSFFAFQGISYLVDVYLEVIDPELHLGRFALYMAFFPKLLQGPIERGNDLLPQLADLQFNAAAASAGLRRFMWGLFKKLVVADRLAVLVNPVFATVHNYTGLTLILAVYLYAFQLYFDFSGYTDMALGIARLFNLRLSENFNQPYLAHSIAEFWRRWHISFSRWILDYIFRPLQMTWRRWGTWGIAAALLVAFLASGLWHGSNWGFIIWGLLFGIYMVIETLYGPLRKKIDRKLRIEKAWWARLWQIALTFNLVAFAWIFFRANTFPDALYVAANLFNGVQVLDCAKAVVKYGAYQPILKQTWDAGKFVSESQTACLTTLNNFPRFPEKFALENGWVLAISLLLLAVSGWVNRRIPVGRWPVVLRWLGYLVFALWILFALGVLETPGQAFKEFLYFRF